MARGSASAVRGGGRPIVFLALALLLTLLLARSFPIDSDEGYTLGAAWQLWNGARMYDDFRLFAGPGCGYAVFWLWKLMGSASHPGARLLAVAFSFSSTAAFYLLLRRIGVRALIVGGATVVWLILSALYVPLNHNSFSSYAAIWLLLPLLRATETAGTGRAAPVLTGMAAGAAAGVVFLFLPTKGALLAAGAGLWLLWLDLRRRAFRPTLGFFGAFVVVAALLCLRWRPALLLQQWLTIPLTGDYLGHTGASRPALVLVLLVALGMVAFALRTGDRLLQLLALVQTALFASTGHNLELHHVAINAFPAVLFAAVALHRRLAGAGRLLAFPGEAVLGTVAATLIGWTIASPVGAGFFASSALSVDLLGRGPKISVSPRVEAAHAIYAGPFLPSLYYLFGKKNPFFVSETVVCDDACQRRLVGELEAVRPEVAYLNYEMIQHLAYNQDAPVDSFLRRHYVRCPDRGFFEIRAIAPGWCP
jgi:hypothetical protein